MRRLLIDLIHLCGAAVETARDLSGFAFDVTEDVLDGLFAVVVGE